MSAAPQHPAAEPSRGPPSYEFSEAHKESFRALSASTSFLGVCAMLFGGLFVVFTLGELYEGFFGYAAATAAGGALSVVMAAWMLSAGRSLAAMLRTRGGDVEHLMAAVTQLRRLFALARILIVVATMGMVGLASTVVWCSVVRTGGRCWGLFG